ncbi:MAG TPA: MAPEG family protein, partial [Rhizomicrobium sp.]|nr:MAPEG family protein [Rhizomicrobium sp.]
LIMLILSILVVRARVKTQVVIGDGGKPEMAAPLRAHANNAEYVPMGLLLMLAMLPLGASFWLTHAVGIPLTLGRILHAIGLSGSTGPSTWRFVGMIFTWIAYIVGIVAVLWLAFVPNAVAS